MPAFSRRPAGAGAPSVPTAPLMGGRRGTDSGTCMSKCPESCFCWGTVFFVCIITVSPTFSTLNHCLLSNLWPLGAHNHFSRIIRKDKSMTKCVFSK